MSAALVVPRVAICSSPLHLHPLVASLDLDFMHVRRDAWDEVRGMSDEVAEHSYVQALNALVPNWREIAAAAEQLSESTPTEG